VERLRVVLVSAGCDGVGDGSGEIEAQFAEGDTEAVDHDAADGEEPDDYKHDFAKLFGIAAFFAIRVRDLV